MKHSRITALLLALVMILGSAALAAGVGKEVTIYPGVSITVNGKEVNPVDVNGKEVETFIYNDSTYVPVRYLSEILGWDVEWDGENNTVKLTTDQPLTYTGVGSGRNGDIKVAVSFVGSEITDVRVTEHKESSGVADAALELMPQWIVANQSINVDTVGGATATSAAIRQAVQAAIRKAGLKVSDYTARPAAHEAVKLDDMTADVVVVGSGLAGMMAALAARDSGASVIVVEKQYMTGGSSALSSAYMRVSESDFLAKEFPDFDQSIDTFVEYARSEAEKSNTTGYEADMDYLRFVEEHVNETVNYMLDLGLTGKCSASGKTGAVSWTGSGAGVMKSLTTIAQEKGITVLTNTTAKSILMDNGAAAGIQCVSNGDDLTIHASKVILATGGSSFAEGAEYTNFPAESQATLLQLAATGTTGDGQRMAAEVGAEIEGALRIKQAGVTLRQSLLNVVKKRPSNAKCLVVNAEGKRVLSEANLNTNTLLATGSPSYWIIVDSSDANIVANMKAGVEGGAPVYYGATIEELAGKINVDPATLRATFDRYNELCAQGEDTDLGKAAKNLIAYTGTEGYYSYELCAGGWGTMGGGIVSDYTGHVLTASGDKIPNLFAVGECSDGHIFGDNYIGGMSISVFTTAGRVVGQTAADEL